MLNGMQDVIIELIIDDYKDQILKYIDLLPVWRLN